MLRQSEEKYLVHNQTRRRRRRRMFSFPIIDVYTIILSLLLIKYFNVVTALIPYPKASLYKKLEDNQSDSISIPQAPHANILTEIFELKKKDDKLFKTEYKNDKVEHRYNFTDTNKRAKNFKQNQLSSLLSSAKDNNVSSIIQSYIKSKDSKLQKSYIPISDQQNLKKNIQINQTKSLFDNITSNLLLGNNFRPINSSSFGDVNSSSFIGNDQLEMIDGNDKNQFNDQELILDNKKNNINSFKTNNNIDTINSVLPIDSLTSEEQNALLKKKNVFRDFEFPEAFNINTNNAIPTNDKMFIGSNANSFPQTQRALNIECFNANCHAPNNLNKVGYSSSINLYPTNNNYMLNNNDLSGFENNINMPFPMSFPNEETNVKINSFPIDSPINRNEGNGFGSSYGTGISSNSNAIMGTNMRYGNEMSDNNFGYGNINNNYIPFGNNNGNMVKEMQNLNSGCDGNLGTNEDANYVSNALNNVNINNYENQNLINNNGKIGSYEGNSNFANKNYGTYNLPNGNYIFNNNNGIMGINKFKNSNCEGNNMFCSLSGPENSGTMFPNNIGNLGFGNENKMIIMPNSLTYGNNNNMASNGNELTVSSPGINSAMLTANRVEKLGDYENGESEIFINGNNNKGNDFDPQNLYRYNKYLELINRKYGIVVPGGHPIPVKNFPSPAINNINEFTGDSAGENMKNNNFNKNREISTVSSNQNEVPFSLGFMIGNENKGSLSKTMTIEPEKTSPGINSNTQDYGTLIEQNQQQFFALTGADKGDNKPEPLYGTATKIKSQTQIINGSQNNNPIETITQLPTYTSIQAITQQIRRFPAVFYVNSRDEKARKTGAMLREIYGLPLISFYVDKIENPILVEKNLQQLTAHKTMPYLFICGTFIGTQDHIDNYHNGHQIPQLVEYVCGEKKNKEKKSIKNRLRKRKKRPPTFFVPFKET